MGSGGVDTVGGLVLEGVLVGCWVDCKMVLKSGFLGKAWHVRIATVSVRAFQTSKNS